MLGNLDGATTSFDVVVAGGGVIGLSVALRVLASGRTVALVDPLPGQGAAWVAAGMLAPGSEAHFGEAALTRFLLDAAARWPRFAAEVEDLAGRSIGFRTTPTLAVGVDATDRAEVRRLLRYQQSLGIDVEFIERDALRSREPLLAASLVEGAVFRGDHQVDNRALVTALIDAVVARGGVIVRDEVRSVEALDDRASLETATSGVLTGGDVVVALGARSSQLLGLDAAAFPHVRPVKGHVLRLRGDQPLVEMTIRGLVRGRPIYLVPRIDGQLVVGATSEERGFDTTVTAGDVHQLLDDARVLVPGIDELALEEARAGLRPGTTSNAPTIQRLGASRCVVATGHYRNGVLLAPVTAEIVLGILDDAPSPAADLLQAVDVS